MKSKSLIYISFNLNQEQTAKISIFNMKGQKVKEIVNANLGSGTHSFIWNGIDILGNKSSSGIYFSFRYKNRLIQIM